MIFFGAACVQQKFKASLLEIEEDVSQKRLDIERLTQASTRSLTWSQACAMLEQDNLTLQQARLRIKSLDVDRRRFLLHELNPRINGIWSFGAAFSELGALGSGSQAFRLLGSVNLPDPLTLYARRYSLEVQYYLGVIDLELLERRLKASLYGHFLQYEVLMNPSSASPARWNEGASVDTLFLNDLQKKRSEYELKISKKRVNQALNRLFNTPGERWKLRFKTLPKISYENQLDRLNSEQGYGALALRQAAGQIMVSRARLGRLKVDRFPNLSTGVGLPTIFDTREVNDFSVDDVRLFTSVSKAYDLIGQKRRREKRVKEQVKFIEDQLSLRLERDISELDEVKSKYQMLVNDISRLKRQLNWIDKNPPSVGADSVLAHLSEKKSLEDRLFKFQIQQRYIDLKFWVWDEKYWDYKINIQSP